MDALIGLFFKLLREQQGLGQSEASSLMGITVNSKLSKLEAGSQAWLYCDVISALELYGVSHDSMQQFVKAARGAK